MLRQHLRFHRCHRRALNGTGLSLKVSEDSDSFFREVLRLAQEHNFTVPPIGLYFLYGALRDPAILAGILDLEVLPILRPAYVLSYKKKMWGQYPALVDAEPSARADGSVFDVPNTEAARKLAFYETKNYRPAPYSVWCTDEESLETIQWNTFQYCANSRDLSEGDFDLSLWLKRMGLVDANIYVGPNP